MKIKSLFLILHCLLLVTGCKDTVATPPWSFECQLRILDQDGNSLLQKNKQKINEITVKMIEPSDNDTESYVYYLESDDFLSIHVSEWLGGKKNHANRLQDYIIELQSPDVFSKQEKDTIRIRYKFSNNYPSIIEAFFNDEKPESMTIRKTVFIVKQD